MNSFDDIHPEHNSTPLRRDAHFRVHQTADGRREEHLLEGKVISLSADGSIDCATTTVAHFYHCGHPSTDPMGHACAQANCYNLSCRECSKDARCARCLKPLCLEHLQSLRTPIGTVHVCGGCKADLARKQHWQAFSRALLKPFIEFDSSTES